MAQDNFDKDLLILQKGFHDIVQDLLVVNQLFLAFMLLDAVRYQ